MCNSPTSGARMSVGDGTLTIVAKSSAVMEKILEKVLLHSADILFLGRPYWRALVQLLSAFLMYS